MTIASTLTTKQYTSTGVNTQFAFPNKIFSAADLAVTIFDLNGVAYPFVNFANATLGLTFSVQNVDVDTGCTVILSNAFTLNWTIDIRTQTAEIQSTSVKNQGSFLPELHEEAFDRLTRMTQDLQRLTYQFGIHGPDTEVTPWPALPVPSLRRSYGLLFDAITGLPGLGFLSAQNVTTGLIAPLLNLQQSVAEGSLGITPINFGYPPGNVLRYGADPTGAADSSVAFLQARQVATAANIELLIPGGNYKSIATLIWGFTGLQVTATGKVTITFTNAGQCITLDGGAAGQGIVGVRVSGYIKAIGNNLTTDAWFVRACHHSKLRMRAGDCTTGLRINWSVLTEFDFICSSNEGVFSALVPTTGMVLDQRGAGETTATCTFTTPTLEGILSSAGLGIDLVGTFCNTFLGGTSESNKIGIRQSNSNNVRNVFIGFDMESNATQDVLVTAGSNLQFDNCSSFSLGTPQPNIDLQGGDNTTFIDCNLRWVHVVTSPTATGTTFLGCQVNNGVSTGIKLDAGAIIKSLGTQLVNGSGVVTAPYNDDLGNTGTFTPTISGGTTPGTQTYAANGQKGYYTLNGHVCSFTLFINLTANGGGAAGTAILGGLPFAGRNQTNCFQSFNINDYSGITLGAAGRTLSATMNPGSATAGLLETDTASVHNPIAITAIAATANFVVSGTYLID